MNKAALTSITPDAFRKRLLVEGCFGFDATHELLQRYFEGVTRQLNLRAYGAQIIHGTSGQDKYAL